MKDFKKFNGSRGKFDRGSRQNFSRKPQFNSFNNNKGNFRDKEMFGAVCESCQKSCEVPFKPNGKKPVYCADCFDGQEKNSNNTRQSFDRKKFGGRDSHQAPKESRNDSRIDLLQSKVEMLDSKLDKILDLIQNTKAPAVPFSINSVSEETKKVLKEASAKKTTKKKTAKKVTKKKK